jgi:hypothetical protein
MGIRRLVQELSINMYVYVNCHTPPQVTACCDRTCGPTFDRHHQFEFRNIPRLHYLVGLKGRLTNYILEGSAEMNVIIYGKNIFPYGSMKMQVQTTLCGTETCVTLSSS